MQWLDELEKKAEENAKRWEDISQIAELLKTKRKDSSTSAKELSELNSDLLLLLVDQFMPLGKKSSGSPSGLRDTLKSLSEKLKEVK